MFMKEVKPVSKKVLAVDDDVDVCELVKVNLEKEGYGVDVANFGGEALEKLKTLSYDLLILDLNMPAVDGWEVLKKVKEDEKTKELPVIILTGKTEEKDMLKGYEHGAETYLVKPFDPQTLLAVVKDLIGN